MALEPGTVVAERYRIETELGRGGMGSVWRARHLALDTPCAVKFIEEHLGTDPELRARFEREAKAAALLRSPNVVQVLDHGVWGGVPFIVMELLEGEDLAARLAARGRLPPVEVVEVIRDVARALTRAHAAGVVHRDLKPENVYLVRDGDREIAKVLDFGIAKADGVGAVATKTRTGAILGTPHYMSPEQADGTRPIDHRTDLWSLAVIAFECLTGQRPFESDALGDLLMRIIHRPIPTAGDVGCDLGPAFDLWWARATSRDPDGRFGSAAELTSGLADAVGLAPRASTPGTDQSPRHVVITPPSVGRAVASSTGMTHSETMIAPPTLGGQTTPNAAMSMPPRWRKAAGAAVVLLVAATALVSLRLLGSRASNDAAPAGLMAEQAAPAAPPSPSPESSHGAVPTLAAPISTPSSPAIADAEGVAPAPPTAVASSSAAAVAAPSAVPGRRPSGVPAAKTAAPPDFGF